ncbi:MAG: class I SAM-dependent methyltransferase [Anaerolineae bacterium]|nr:class I SAM-dependent methyltransferase [Anaerolineae bacterium]
MSGRRWARSVLCLFFRLLYGPCAWAYDTVAWVVSRGKWTAWGMAALPFIPGGPVLELAHGPGHLLLPMASRGLQPVGLDLSPQMGARAHRRLGRAGLPPRLVQARAQRLPFPNGSFRAVVATFPTEFIIDPATARETARVLVPGGTVVIIPTAIPGGRDPLACALRFLYRITGQDRFPSRDPFQAWRAAGFSLHTEWRPVGPDAVLVIRGTRP